MRMTCDVCGAGLNVHQISEDYYEVEPCESCMMDKYSEGREDGAREVNE